MKNLVLIFLFCFLVACSLQPTSSPIRAVYLVQQGGQLAEEDLKKHPEIFVTHSFTEFQKAARQRTGLWIDKNAVALVDSKWLDEPPQSSYPILVVGYNDPLLSFRDSLQLCCFMGPAQPDDLGAEPGFSVIQRQSEDPEGAITMLEGFKQTPTVDDLLRITNELLDRKIQATPTPSLPDIITPTP